MLRTHSTRQTKTYFCGPACLQAFLQYFHIPATQHDLAKIARTNPAHGTDHKGMIRALRGFGFKTVVKENKTSLRDIRYYIKKGVPVIVNWYSVSHPPASGHYSVVVGTSSSTVTLMDPEFGKLKTMKNQDFSQLWFDFAGNLAHARLPVKTYFRWMLAGIPPQHTGVQIKN